MLNQKAPSQASLSALFKIFFMIGLTSFGMSMLENLKRIALKRGLVSEAEIREGLAMVQLYPGPILFDLVTFIGYRRRGTLGAISAALGFILPATTMMLVVAWLYRTYGEVPEVRSLSVGLGAAVLGVIVHVTTDFAQKNLHRIAEWACALMAFVAAVLGIDPIVVIAVAFAGGAYFWNETTRETPPTPDKHQRENGIVIPLVISVTIAGLAIVAVFSDGAIASLTTVFMKIGATAFGNASTILPVMQDAVVRDREWLSATDFNVAVAFGNLTPGPILNSATFIGYQVAGWQGGLVATFSVFAPSFAMTLLFTEIFARISHLGWIRGGVHGVTVVFVGLLAATVIFMGSPITNQPTLIMIGGLTFALLRFTKLQVATVFLIALAIWGYWTLR
jgi:chromate transporter